VRAPTRERRELFANTVAAWTWSQGTLAASVLALPVLTHLLSKSEFGLWTQLLSLSALATVADLGMSLVFLRRITDGTDDDGACILRSATAFYRVSSALLAAVLMLACLVPGGLLAPYLSRTRMPALAAAMVIAAMGVNLGCQPWALRLLARGRVDLERIFGAGPAVTGTLASILAAYFFRTAVAVAAGYAAVEIAFDAGLVVAAHRCWGRTRTGPAARPRPAARPGLTWWGRVWYESTGVLAIDLVPQVSMVIGVAVVGHVAGAAAAAVYGVAWKAGSLVRRFFAPFAASLFVSLCRSAGPARAALAGLSARLSSVALAGGAAAAFLVVAAGAAGMRLVFGGGYGSGAWAVLFLVLAETIRSIYGPFLRMLQSENRIGSLRYWFAASMAAQVPMAAVAATRWSAAGAAAAMLACSTVFEAAPVVRRLSAYHRSRGAGRTAVLRQAGTVTCAGGIALLLAWGRQRAGAAVIAFSAASALTAGLIAVRLMVRYLAAARRVTSTSLVPGTE
jgi:O-antigen/teichoic acid export membrane protein